MGRKQTLTEIQRELGPQSSELLSLLSDTELVQLLQSVRAAQLRQKDALNQAINRGMSFVPALLRIPLKKILFP